MNQKILIVEDDATSREIMKLSLKNKGYELEVVKDGMAAYESALANPPDIILMDIKMPGWSGYETCIAFKSNQILTKIPIIFVTSAINDIEKAFAAGGVDYVIKPIRASELTMRIGFHLERAQSAEGVEKINLALKQEIARKDAELAQKSRLLKEALDEISRLKG